MRRLADAGAADKRIGVAEIVAHDCRYVELSIAIAIASQDAKSLLTLTLQKVAGLDLDICHESVRLWVDRFGTMFAPQSMPRSTIISTEKDTSTAAQFSKLNDPKRFRNGATLREWLAEKSCLSGN